MASPVFKPAETKSKHIDSSARSSSNHRVQILESEAGSSRRMLLERHLRSVTPAPTRIWVVSCDFDLGGPWAGVNRFFSSIIEEISAERPDLLEKHAFELVHVLPILRKALIPNASLTDLATGEEKVRNYAADRAFRLVHGLIDLLDSWKSAASTNLAWGIACDDFDRSGAIGRRFFRELMRRRGERLDIRVIAAVKVGSGAEVRNWFFAPEEVGLIAEYVAPQTADPLDAAAAADLASELEAKVGDDYVSKQAHLADLIRLWRLAGQGDKLLYWKLFAVGHYVHQGLYEDGGRYAEGMIELSEKHDSRNNGLRLAILVNKLNVYAGIADGVGGLKFVEDFVLQEFEEPSCREHVGLLFLVAMMYARYKQPRDLTRGEAYLDRALAVLERLDLPEEEFHFEYVFNRNGVAMIRNFEGRLEDAIELCRAGIDRLNAHLRPGSHRLHRSVLAYNTAQVYFAMGALPEALERYTAVIALDPNYSEYYNERGNVFVRAGSLEEARADYLEAIRLSPPYPEVHTNLGQCYRRLGALRDAIECYSRALDLDPGQNLALLGRAKAREDLGQRRDAIADYSAALARDPAQWDALASRGVLHYEAGDLLSCLADLDEAVKLRPLERDLYRNRSIVLADLGRVADAAADLETAARLDPKRDDAAELREDLGATASTPS